MKGKRVTIIKTNLVDLDPRLSKEINTLKRGGYAVTLVCWDRHKTSFPEKREINDHYREIRLRFKAPCGIKILPFLPIWWCFELFYIIKSNPDVVHAINYDTVVPAIILSKIKQNSMIYEMFDLHEDTVLLPRIVRNVCIYIDKLFMRLADAVIVVDKSRIKELNGIPNDNIVVIYNSPPDFLVKLPTHSQKNDNRNLFTILYAGLLNKYRSIEKVIAAVKVIEGVELIIAGFGDQVKETKKCADENPEKIQFMGKISYTDVLELSLSADILFSLYDPIVPLHKFASSNKLFEAMMCGKPILVSDGTSMADIVRKYNCGIVVNSQDISEIQNAIIKLKNDTQLCKQLGANGRRAYEERYNWGIMGKRLLALYHELTGGRT